MKRINKNRLINLIKEAVDNYLSYDDYEAFGTELPEHDSNWFKVKQEQLQRYKNNAIKCRENIYKFEISDYAKGRYNDTLLKIAINKAKTNLNVLHGIIWKYEEKYNIDKPISDVNECEHIYSEMLHIGGEMDSVIREQKNQYGNYIQQLNNEMDNIENPEDVQMQNYKIMAVSIERDLFSVNSIKISKYWECLGEYYRTLIELLNEM